MHSLRAVLIGQGIDGHFVRDHECGIKSQTEMSDDLVSGSLVLVFFQERLRAGKRDIIDVFLDLISGHAKAVITDLDNLFRRVDDDIDPCLIIFRQFIITDHIQLFQLGDRVAAVGDQLSQKDIMV